ncbi:MAG: nucleotidyltransferase domain-containing protein [Geodermatophilaceae bacterium]
MYTAAQRSGVRDGLIAEARADERVTAAALVGSAAAGREDQWSDIDFAVRLAGDVEPAEIADDWTARMYADYGAVHHLDI